MARIGGKYRIVNGKKARTFEGIVKVYNRLPNKVKLELLWEALDIMNAYNGRTKWACIIIAMGYEQDTIEVEGSKEEYYVKTSQDGN